MNTRVWPFLVGRNRTLGYQVIVSPRFLAENDHSRLLAYAAGGNDSTPGNATIREVLGSEIGTITVIFRVVRAQAQEYDIEGNDVLEDEGGRPIRLMEGVVVQGGIEQIKNIVLTQEDFQIVHEQVKKAYQVFWATNESFSEWTSQPLALKAPVNAADQVTLKEEAPLEVPRLPATGRDVRPTTRVSDHTPSIPIKNGMASTTDARRLWPKTDSVISQHNAPYTPNTLGMLPGSNDPTIISNCFTGNTPLFQTQTMNLISIFIYNIAGLLLLLNVFLLFNILDLVIFLKKMLRYHLVIFLLVAGLVVIIISGAIVYDSISTLRKKSRSQPSPVVQHQRTTLHGVSWYRKALAYRAIIVICLIVICIPLSFWRYNTVEGVGLSPDNPRIGVCDGSCILDGDRSTGNLKQEAAKYFQQKQDALACQYLRWAAIGDITGPETTNPEQNDARSQAEDTTDAEAKIDYENRCTNMQCPCISFVVAVQFIDQGDSNADYINGMSRSILQGAYLQQKKWNRSHSSGPEMYLFIANVRPDVPGDQGQEATQQEVANQILRIQQSDQDHVVVGVVGLPFGINTLTSKLSDAHIPMVSIAPLVSSNSKPYLFSVAPSLDDEINKVANFCPGFQKIQYYYDENDDYSQTFTQLFQASSNLPSDVNPIPYKNITSLANQVAASDSDLAIFIGPAEDTTNFLIQLRAAEKANNSKSHTVLAGDNLYQWVYTYFKPSDRTAFDNAYFPAFAYPQPDQLPIDLHMQDNFNHMLDDFNKTFDPGGKRSGNIYTYHRASSDAILAYDALSLLTNAQEHTNCTVSCDTSVWGDTLQHYIKSKSFQGVSGQISFISGNSVPNSKFSFFLVIQDQKNGNPQDFSGRY